MRLRRRAAGWLLVAAIVTTLGVSSGVQPVGAKPTAGSARVCDTAVKRRAGCEVTVRTDASGRPLGRAAAAAAGLRPYTAADLQDAYRLPSDLLGARQTIAIVTAYDAPNLGADVAAYRAANGLPPCDDEFPCLRKVDQRGGTDYPHAEQSWSLSATVSAEVASAVCPNCRLLVVEADDNTLANLGAAVDTAVRLGADVVSNGYHGTEYTGMATDLGSHYDHAEAVVVATAGSGGMGAVVPAALSTVVAVGGTTLYRDASDRGWAEQAWKATGSGCSAYVAKPSWQNDKLCAKRTLTDVAAVADPNTPVAVYATFGYPGWVAAGGTAVATALIAGVYALAGNAGDVSPGTYLSGHRKLLFDVTSGSNGQCGGSYLCTAGRGYDGPTGWGTPNGVGAF